MVNKTKHLGLEHLDVGDQLTHGIENRRFTTLDVQLESIYRALGNGRISGQGTWELTDYTGAAIPTPRNDNLYFTQDAINTVNNSRFIYMSPGFGHANHMAIETVEHVKIGPLPYVTNYIYFYTTDITPRTKRPGIRVYPTRLDENNPQFLNIGEVTVDNTNAITNINQDSLLEVSALSFLLADLIQHTHGKDGIAKIDLETEVRGLLPADNISDIDPSRINTGTLNPAIISLRHSLLKESGILTHAELDSAVELLQTSNKKLFGDLTTANLIQSILAVKKVYVDVDTYFRNFIAIIAGIDNITEDNPNSFLDHTSVVFSATEAGDAAAKAAAIADPGDDTREDAAIADYTNFEFRGLLSSGNTPGEHSVDTEAEFEEGDYNDNFVSVTSEAQWVYGFGLGYGAGNNFFDVFGVATGQFQDGAPFHYGYGLPDFEAALAFDEFALGYGYQLTDGGDFQAGHVAVSLVPGQSDVQLYPAAGGTWTDTEGPSPNSNDLMHADQKDNFYKIEKDDSIGDLPSLPGAPDPLTDDPHFYMSGVVVDEGEGLLEELINYDSILRYRVNENSTTFDGDLSSYKSFNIDFGRTFSYDVRSGNDWTTVTTNTYTLEYAWYFRLVFQDSVATTFKFETEIINMAAGDIIGSGVTAYASLSNLPSVLPDYATYDLKFIEIVPYVGGTKFAPISQPWDYFSASPTDDQKGPDQSGGNAPMIWHSAISSMGLSGVVNYGGTDTQNTIRKLYVVIPASQTVVWDTVSWNGREEGDSRIAIQLRTVDANEVVGDPFDALEDAEFGHTYSNKSGSVDGGAVEPARPSGSTITEGSENDDGVSQGTHLEVKVVLQAGEVTDIAPILHSVTIRYTSPTGPSEAVIEGSEGFNSNLQTTSDRINIKLTPVSEESIQISKHSDISKLLFGKSSSFSKYDRLGDRGFILETSDNERIAYAPPSPHQILNGETSDTAAPSGSLYAVKRMLNHDLIVADTDNHRVLIYDANTLQFKKGIYGSVGLTTTNRYSSTTAIDKEFSILQAIYNKNEKTIYVVFSHILDTLDPEAFRVEAVQVTGSNDVTYIMSNANTFVNGLAYDFEESLLSALDGEGHVLIPGGMYLSVSDGTAAKPGSFLPPGPSNVVRIKLTDQEVNIINNISEPREINIRIKSTNSDGSVSTWFVKPKDIHLLRTAAFSEDEQAIQGDPLFQHTGGETADFDSVPNRLFAPLLEADIYYRPVLNPIDVEVMHDNTFAICNMLSPHYGENGRVGEPSFDAAYRANQLAFEYYFRTTAINGYIAPHIDDVSVNLTSGTHFPIQFYDLDNDDLYDRTSTGVVRVTDGNVDNTDDGNVIFSKPLGGSIKEVLIDDLYYYFIADPGNQRAKIITTDFDEIVWQFDIDDISTTVLGDATATYYPSCADKGSTYYYVSLIGIGGTYLIDNKILEMLHDKTLNRSPILDRQLGNPIDVDVSEPNNSIIIST